MCSTLKLIYSCTLFEISKSTETKFTTSVLITQKPIALAASVPRCDLYEERFNFNSFTKVTILDWDIAKIFQAQHLFCLRTTFKMRYHLIGVHLQFSTRHIFEKLKLCQQLLQITPKTCAKASLPAPSRLTFQAESIFDVYWIPFTSINKVLKSHWDNFQRSRIGAYFSASEICCYAILNRDRQFLGFTDFSVKTLLTMITARIIDKYNFGCGYEKGLVKTLKALHRGKKLI